MIVNDIPMLVGLITFSAFVSYAANETGKAFMCWFVDSLENYLGG
jgi:hypothetical protein